MHFAGQRKPRPTFAAYTPRINVISFFNSGKLGDIFDICNRWHQPDVLNNVLAQVVQELSAGIYSNLWRTVTRIIYAE